MRADLASRWNNNDQRLSLIHKKIIPYFILLRLAFVEKIITCINFVK